MGILFPIKTTLSFIKNEEFYVCEFRIPIKQLATSYSLEYLLRLYTLVFIL
jgi:hypothetical protein